ncbi:3 beta-hydroxysteroid dehydrogenase type 7 isoform X2 [Heliangelus exortis]|uniref:3 beta-hydroxysteroid dehydrogenase type 7 isoform X2 n=1 Tax=Heliangelus exortis TaxID=472823 RepID=UPI003A9165B5
MERETPPDLRGRVVVVTGGAGFLGMHLVRTLLEEEPELKELRVLDLEGPKELQHPDPRVQWLRGDVGDAEAVGRALRGADVVFHCAGKVGVGEGTPPGELGRVNVQGTLNVLAGCRSGGVKVLIYTSSMEVVGPNARGDPFLRGEEQTPYPVRHSHPYGRSKAQAERRVLEGNGMEVFGGGSLVSLSLRPTGIYGEGDPLLARIYREGKARGWLPHTLPPNAEHGRVYVGNVSWLHLLAARSALSRPELLGGEVFFCSDFSPFLPYDVFNFRLLGLPLGGHFLPRFLLLLWAHLNSFLTRFLPHYCPLLTPRTLALASAPFTVRSSKAQRLLGYRPRYSWEEARERTWKWSRSLV